MERIDPSGKPVYSPKNRGKKKAEKPNAGKGLFSSFVDGEGRVEGSDAAFAGLDLESDSSLEEMLDAIHSIGDLIRENANYETIGKYRTAVRSFMRYVMTHALSVEERRSSPNILRQKKYTLVKIIDQKLERLASGVLLNQYDTLKILSKVDEINGLLVDLIR